LFIIGAAIAISSRPVFTFMLDEVKEVPMSEIIMNYTFDIYQSQDKLVEFKISIGQKLNILTTANSLFNFSIANFTDPNNISQPDQPDVVYLTMSNITTANTTWNPVIRSAEPGSYYLIFLAPNAPIDSPVQIFANITKTWTDVQPYQAPYKKSLIDPNFVYVGLGILFAGGIISIAAFISRNRRGRTGQTSTLETIRR